MPKTADQALYEVLSAHAGLQALLGSDTSMRCYPVEAPVNTALPLLVFQSIGSNEVGTHGQGLVAGESRLDQVQYQLTALAATGLGAAAVLYQARLALEASTVLRAVQTSGDRALPRDENAQAHGRSADFFIWNDPDAS